MRKTEQEEGPKADKSPRLIELVYDELRGIAASKLSREREDHTLNPTDLVHEAWLRLGDSGQFKNDRHYVAVAAMAMRRLLVEHARRKASVRHGGKEKRSDVDAADLVDVVGDADEILMVNEALDSLEAVDARKAKMVELCYFVGHTFKEAGDIMGVSERTIKRDWIFARAWLYRAVEALKKS